MKHIFWVLLTSKTFDCVQDGNIKAHLSRLLPNAESNWTTSGVTNAELSVYVADDTFFMTQIMNAMNASDKMCTCTENKYH